MSRQSELVERVRAYDPSADEAMLKRAYTFSMKAHGSQLRQSGDPYFAHPLEVAGILADMRLDSATIVTALLHDTVEDTLATLDEIEHSFGPEVARLVDGVTKLSQLEVPATSATRQAENFRKLFLAMSDDIRVLLVKLADRLHNMQTLGHMPQDKRRHIAQETMDIYAPLAERIGMLDMKEALEDLAFAEINPDARESVFARLRYLREASGDLNGRISQQLKETLATAGVAAEVLGREKRPWSIWKKMERDSISFEQLSDIVAFRIVVPTREECYTALGIVHGRFQMVPERFKDYISTPKRNGYRSIHTTVIGPEKHRIEVQIRSREMHQEAELGVAAHWQYKQQADGVDPNHFRWVRELLDVLDVTSNPEEFFENTKLEMFQDQVFCFSPAGELIVLPRGATPVDFAYAVHTDVGDTCVGAKINGRIAPLRTRLCNGDQVEIIRSSTQTPSPAWETFVVTGKARSAIRRFRAKQERSQYEELGRKMLQNAFREAGHEFREDALAPALKAFRHKTVEDLDVAVGGGDLASRAVVEAVLPGERKAARGAGKPVRRKAGAKGGDHAIPIRGLIPGMAVHLAACCHPLPGDRIVGIVSAGKGVTVHTIDCESLQAFADSPERWLDVAWDAAAKTPEHTVSRVHTVLSNTPGSLSALASVIARNQGNISNLKITDRDPEFFEMQVDIEVRDAKHLSNILAALRLDPAIASVERVRG
jgi:guanosine-3',5'-bis(diphosphate) 3'-pyrophosphohydrolase